MDRRLTVIESEGGLPLHHFLMSYPCGLQRMLALFREMLEVLAADHAGGRIHGALKPADILVDPDAANMLMNFGSAPGPVPAADAASPRVTIGAVNYLAPEVVSGKPATERADVYSLGLIFFHMLTGETPFSGRTVEENMEKIRTAALAFPPRLQLLL